MKLHTMHAIHWRDAGQICSSSIDSKTRVAWISDGFINRQPSRLSLLKNREAMLALIAAFEDYLSAHHTDDDSVLEVELLDGPISYTQLFDLAYPKKERAQ